MRIIVSIAALAVAALPAAAAPVTGRDKVLCLFGDAARPVPCVLTDTVTRGGHQMVFTAGRQRTTFVGRNNSAWWQGRLNGRPAMGYERDRGHTVYSSLDLTTRFEWWYPGGGSGR